RELRRVALHWLPGRGVLGVERWGAPGASAPAERLAEDAPALVTWTTGSTGRPRAAVRSHGFLWAQHRVLAAHLGLHEHDLDMPTLPFFVLNNLACGVPSVIPDADPRRTAAFRPAAVFRQMEEHGVTTASGSPAFWERLARWCGPSGNRLPLRALWTGGAPVLPPLARLLQRSVAGTAHVVYGSTEAEPISGIPVPQMLALLDGAEAAEGGVCVGAPVAGIRLRIVRPHEGPIRLGAAGWAEWETEPGDTGEVVVAGTHVLGGYLHDPDAERALKIRDGACVWHRTGDAARLDAAGRLWLMGRVAERVRRDGRNWWSGAVEARAVEVEGVAHAAYLRMPGEGRRDRAVLCVEAGSMPPDSGLEQRLRAAIAPAPVDELRILRCIPRDPRHASKTDAAALRRLLG
ncbi:MAG: AMP-binding protein, partial [Gemmatimonadota bacterium]|nr:AMP-binding protein [Gemmatimonadota bacterium]